MKKFIQRLLWKQDPALYRSKDAKLTPSLRTIDLVGLGTGMVVGTAIFTLPGIVAAEHTGQQCHWHLSLPRLGPDYQR